LGNVINIDKSKSFSTDKFVRKRLRCKSKASRTTIPVRRIRCKTKLPPSVNFKVALGSKYLGQYIETTLRRNRSGGVVRFDKLLETMARLKSLKCLGEAKHKYGWDGIGGKLGCGLTLSSKPPVAQRAGGIT